MPTSIDGALYVSRHDGVRVGHVTFKDGAVQALLPQGDSISYTNETEAAEFLVSQCTCPELAPYGLCTLTTSLGVQGYSTHDWVRLLPSRLPGYDWGLVVQAQGMSSHHLHVRQFGKPDLMLYGPETDGVRRAVASIGRRSGAWGYATEHDPKTRRQRGSVSKAMMAVEARLSRGLAPWTDDMVMPLLDQISPLRAFSFS